MSNNTQNEATTIMVFGTFDGIHLGHLNLLKQARELSRFPYLIISIARDKNVLKIKKEKPVYTEKQRMNSMKKCTLVDKVVLSGLYNHIPHILKENPDIIALGYDQKEYVKNLKKDLAKNGKKNIKIVRLKPYKIDIYKNHLLKNKRVL
ncbi:MAG: adenylyltransferase/cytidyltransferase family protein [bacterium]|nr:adenylyltransferase/cytidyltransferase family protein [bacterium]